MRWRPVWITLVALLTLVSVTMASQTIGTGKRGQLSGRYKGRKNFKPITGTYPSVEAKDYYTNPKGAKITKSSHFNYQYVLGHKIVFLCVAKGIPLPQITWFKDGVELYAHRYMQLHEWKFGNNLKSKMEIDPATQADAGIYECHANNKYAVDTKAFRTTYVAEFNK
ncbi:immunoglobulin domain-containing protein oig-4-like [Eriocheir sinensis]|uniref:immunoglobulin domain-containing protein oig-4-like n=1 Tax=Eriocheir sinensis TaxID=95602 RepID=UPI0021CA393B|nr:immunoglobulin domain-containing protein oig-4-like [Eriocheir sinensis]